MPSSTTSKRSSKATPKASPSKKARIVESEEEDDYRGAEDDDQEESEDDGASVASEDVDDEPVKASSSKSTPKSAGKAKGKAKAETSSKGKGKAKDEDFVAGQISKSSLDFLNALARNNTREWFQERDSTYRRVWAEWQAFVDAASATLNKNDWTIPILPSKDLVYRIYRDVRFSKDKTPYKTSMSASFSRTGRKGPYAGYYLQVKAKQQSLIADGLWSPDKNQLATLRTNLLRDSKPFRQLIEAPEFVKLFGKPDASGPRTNIFGRDDQLKNAPKMPGVDKKHPDIDLLRCRSFVVAKTFTDADVLSEDFQDRIGQAVAVMASFVSYLNELTTPRSDDDEEEDEEGEDEESDQGVDN